MKSTVMGGDMEEGGKLYGLFCGGDTAVFDDLVKQYQKDMILFIAQYTCDYQIAEDVSQDVFVKLFVNKPRYKPSASFKTW